MNGRNRVRNGSTDLLTRFKNGTAGTVRLYPCKTQPATMNLKYLRLKLIPNQKPLCNNALCILPSLNPLRAKDCWMRHIFVICDLSS